MIELLIVKEGEEYFRFSDTGASRCAMNKATVYPLNQKEQARKACNALIENGVAASLMKLTIEEEPFD